MEEKKYPIGGFAPGNYTCKCCICKQEFQGDKRAVQCESCAVKALRELLKPYEQPCAVWVRASERLPVPGFYNAKKNGSPFTLAMTVRDKKMPKEYWENVEWLDESGAAAAPSVDVAFGVDKWNEWRAWFSIGVQKFHLQNSENKEHAEWYEKMLRKAFANLGNGTAAAGISQDAHEKEVMMQAFDKVRHIFEGRQWVMDGRGSYPYNDDRYKEEVRYMYNEFDQVVKDTWANIKSKSVDYRKAIIAEYLESAAGRKEAVEKAMAFAEWCNKNYKQHFGGWKSWNEKFPAFYSTKELWNLFKQQNGK